jgi:hypothetical protein
MSREHRQANVRPTGRVCARPARNTTLISLAADLPVAVLADLVGMSPTTAVRWARLTNRDWTLYVAAVIAPARAPQD